MDPTTVFCPNRACPARGQTGHGGGEHRPLLDDARAAVVQVPLSRWTPPKRRGRLSRALQRLIERWCA
jgi:hypothetical protein